MENKLSLYHVSITAGDEPRLRLEYSVYAKNMDDAIDRRPFWLPKTGRAVLKKPNDPTYKPIIYGWSCSRAIPPRGEEGYSFVLGHYIGPA